MTKKNPGQDFQNQFQISCDEQNIFFHRIKDVYIPFELRAKIRVPKNKYDCFIYHSGILMPLELKSTKGKSFQMKESIIKQHQIDALEEANTYEGVYPGFIFNFRLEKEDDNKVYFIHIKDFLHYQKVASGECENTYYSKVNEKSIPIKICEEIGTEIECVKKNVHYRYFIKEFINKIN